MIGGRHTQLQRWTQRQRHKYRYRYRYRHGNRHRHRYRHLDPDPQTHRPIRACTIFTNAHTHIHVCMYSEESVKVAFGHRGGIDGGGARFEGSWEGGQGGGREGGAITLKRTGTSPARV